MEWGRGITCKEDICQMQGGLSVWGTQAGGRDERTQGEAMLERGVICSKASNGVTQREWGKVGAGLQLQARAFAGCKAAQPCGHSPWSPQVSIRMRDGVQGPRLLLGWLHWVGRSPRALKAHGGLGRPGDGVGVSAAPLTSIRDVAHNVPSNPQLFHVARS